MRSIDKATKDYTSSLFSDFLIPCNSQVLPWSMVDPRPKSIGF